MVYSCIHAHTVNFNVISLTTEGADTNESVSYIRDEQEPLPDRPLQLVKPDLQQHKRLILVEDNVKHLHFIKGAVAVVVVVGKFHSGKSFLLNQLMGKQEGFGIGPSVKPQTMGIWMWGKVAEQFFNCRVNNFLPANGGYKIIRGETIGDIFGY